MATLRLELRAIGGGIDPILSENTYESGSLTVLDEDLAIGTNQLVAFTLDVSQAKAIVLYSDVAMTVCTNDDSGGSPDKTISLVAGQAIVWNSTNGQTNPFGSVDVASLYVTNAAAGTLQILALFDPTV